MRITIADIRRVNGCASPYVLRRFAKAHGLDFKKLIREGWDSNELSVFNDEIANRILRQLGAIEVSP